MWDLDGMVPGWPWPGERCWILERGEVVVVPQIRTSYSAVLKPRSPNLQRCPTPKVLAGYHGTPNTLLPYPATPPNPPKNLAGVICVRV